MFDETVFNRIAANLADLNKSVQELNRTLKQSQRSGAIVAQNADSDSQDSLDSLLRTIDKLRDTKPVGAVAKPCPSITPMMEPEVPYWYPRGWTSNNVNKAM